MPSDLWSIAYIAIIHVILCGLLVSLSLGLYHFGIGLVSPRKNGFWIDRVLPLFLFWSFLYSVNAFFRGHTFPELILGCQAAFVLHFIIGITVGIYRRLKENEG